MTTSALKLGYCPCYVIARYFILKSYIALNLNPHRVLQGAGSAQSITSSVKEGTVMFISGGFGMQDLQYGPLSFPLELRSPPPKQYLLPPVNDGAVFGVYRYCLRGCGLYSGGDSYQDRRYTMGESLGGDVVGQALGRLP